MGETLINFPITNCMLDIDMRFNFGVCLTSGFGKEAIKNVIFNTAEYVNMKYSSPVSLHEEQLVGKQWFDKEAGEVKEIKGYFYDHFLIKDVALPFINDTRFEITRSYILTALDVYGKNIITKKLVVEEEGLFYNARCSFIYFIQSSESIKERNILSGLFRRAPILKVNLGKKDIYEVIDKRMKIEFNPKIENLFEFLRKVGNIKKINYKKISTDLVTKINKGARKYFSTNKLLNTLVIVNQDNLIKLSFINSLLRTGISGKEIELEVNEEDINKALKDYNIIYESIKEFVKENSHLTMHGIKEAIIHILKEKDCITEEKGNITTSNMIDLVVGTTGEKKATVIKHFYKLRQEGVIRSKKVGQCGSKVWLA